MAYRLKVSARALRETGIAREWYEKQHSGLGDEFLAALELQVERLKQAPLLYAEVMPKVRRALLPRFPYGVFYVVRGDLISILAVLHDLRSPDRWPRTSAGV
ncbi:type II toxin-antitoxin system RelE/ParE family toxin [Amphibiibacter pelophylacis]|uniref:Uncharacterized protein n=1 Tax=Amphibiibacter pelophylacis TaxID=1799477 RepID=A0ACC6NZR9_9BURK